MLRVLLVALALGVLLGGRWRASEESIWCRDQGPMDPERSFKSEQDPRRTIRCSNGGELRRHLTPKKYIHQGQDAVSSLPPAFAELEELGRDLCEYRGSSLWFFTQWVPRAFCHPDPGQDGIPEGDRELAVYSVDCHPPRGEWADIPDFGCEWWIRRAIGWDMITLEFPEQ